MDGRATHLHRSPGHTFTKLAEETLTLVAGMGVEGDAHCGPTVRHRSRVSRDPEQPNLRQVHLIPLELYEELRQQGFEVGPGDLGENITTSGIDLPGLPVGAMLRLGRRALVAVTGLRNPCRQIEAFGEGLLGAVLGRGEDGSVVRRAGVMGVVILGGEVRGGDTIEVAVPPGPPIPLRTI